MAELKFKTRGMTDPGKKEKVYFCCHPDEFSYFFESISDEILKRQNCAVWYRDERDPYDEEEHLLDLSGMQLFVMPVTTKLLNTRNRALDVEFRFAVKNHIPVLPLMQESGLDALFNERCGDLQYLDKFNSDDTAISYDEKLTKFLEGVLVGDELAEKIRAAFDAYVFLSYRKKDRRYAQELMRLIHKNDFCRDIAIWYDEFLTPGENFNDSIKEALEKSGLFVLAVTPNLVNEENYIMTTEYPMAIEENKPILPAELVPTDKKLLCEKYKDIPECTDAHDSVALSDALLDSVKKMAIKENDNSHEHNFFIGLAYLSGIDVEVDHERALKLITSSADGGLKEAQEKLVSMYMSGDGVERNFENAILWQRKLVDTYGEIFKNEMTWENLDVWLSTYISVAGKFSIINRYKEAFEICKELIALCDDIADITANDKQIDHTRIRYKSQGYMYAAYFCKDMGDINKSGEYAKISLEIIEALYNENVTLGSFWVKKNYASSLSYVGETYRLVNDIDMALVYFQRALEIKKELRESFGFINDPSNNIEYARSLATVAGIYLLKFETDKATECYSEAMSILQQTEEEHETLETVPLYIDIAITSSAIHRAAGRLLEMDRIFATVIDKIQSYRDATGVMLYYSAYRVHVSLAQSYTMQRRYGEALEQIEKTKEINEEYVNICKKDIDVPLACTVYSLRATIAVENNDNRTARIYIEKAAEYADMCIASGFDIHSADCASVFSLYASIELMDNNIEQSLVYLKKAIAILEENAFSMDDTRALPMFVVSYMNYTVLSSDSGDLASALEYGSKCIEAYEKYRKMAPGIAERSNITFVYYIVSKAKYLADKKDGKEFLLEKCRYFEDMVEKKGLLIDYDGLSTMYIALSGIAGIFERSKWNKKAVKLIEFMEDNFGEQFQTTTVYSLLNNE